MEPLKQEAQVERRPAGRKEAVVCVDEGVDNTKQWRVVARRAYGRHCVRARALRLGGAPRSSSSVLCRFPCPPPDQIQPKMLPPRLLAPAKEDPHNDAPAPHPPPPPPRLL